MSDFITALAKPASKRFAETIRKLASANDDAAAAEYREAIDDMVIKMHATWKDSEAEERPTVDDFFGAARDLADEYERARTNRKRELLNRAFWGRFNPTLYRQGLTQMLWDYVRQLEYPEALLLAELTSKVEEQLKDGSPSTMYTVSRRPKWTAAQVQIEKTDIRYELARRLERVDLVEIEDHQHQVNIAPVLGLAKLLREFIWGDGELAPVLE